LDELADLFRRRLLDDKDKKRAFDSLYERLERAERAAEGDSILPVARQLFLVVDRLDAYDGEDPLLPSVRDEVLEILRRSGLETIATQDRFDPGRHEVVEVAPGGEAEGTILRQVRRGYHIGDRVVRPAHVVVDNGLSSPVAGDAGRESQ
jgi:molecular chaperone GrpE